MALRKSEGLIKLLFLGILRELVVNCLPITGKNTNIPNGINLEDFQKLIEQGDCEKVSVEAIHCEG